MLKDIRVGLGLTGSFCTFDKVIPQIQKILDEGAEVVPIMSNNASSIDTRFGKAEDFKKKIIEMTGKEIVEILVQAEPLGPKNAIDIMVIAPCTGNDNG